MRQILLGLCLIVMSVVVSGCSALSTVIDGKTKAGLQVITGDISASLFLDDQYLEKAPYIGKDIKPGVYTLRIQPDDPTLIPHEVSITLNKGLLTVVTWRPGKRPDLSGGVIYEMEKLPSKNQTELAVVSVPDGAIVSIQGREKEFAPLTISEIDPGQREFEVSLPSYETQRHTINIVEGHKTTITVKLAKNEVMEINATGSLPNSNSTASQSGSLQLATPSGQRTGTASGSSRLTIAGSKVTIQSTGLVENGQEVLRVRDSASSNGNVIGTAPVGNEYTYLNESFSGWYKIQFGNEIGWVSSQYAKLSQ